jgi:hypothetical protein
VFRDDLLLPWWQNKKLPDGIYLSAYWFLSLCRRFFLTPRFFFNPSSSMDRTAHYHPCLSNIIATLRAVNARYHHIAIQFRRHLKPTQHARRHARSLGLSLDIERAMNCPQRAVSAIPLPILDTSSSPTPYQLPPLQKGLSLLQSLPVFGDLANHLVSDTRQLSPSILFSMHPPGCAGSCMRGPRSPPFDGPIQAEDEDEDIFMSSPPGCDSGSSSESASDSPIDIASSSLSPVRDKKIIH